MEGSTSVILTLRKFYRCGDATPVVLGGVADARESCSDCTDVQRLHRLEHGQRFALPPPRASAAGQDVLFHGFDFMEFRVVETIDAVRADRQYVDEVVV